MILSFIDCLTSVSYIWCHINASTKWHIYAPACNVFQYTSSYSSCRLFNTIMCHVKANAYLTIVRPSLEYAACVWDPYQEYLIYDLEKIQRHAARWVLLDYNYCNSVTSMLSSLKWPTLQERRRISRLSQFRKIVHQLTPSIQLPSCFLPTHYPTRQFHQHRFIIPFSSTVMYQKSFFPNTVREWNTLPDNLLEEQSTEFFINHIK